MDGTSGVRRRKAGVASNDKSKLTPTSFHSLISAKLKQINGVGVCELTYEDIQRNDIIGRVLTALEN